MPDKPAITHELGALIAGVRPADIPEAARGIAARGLVDAVGTMIAGSVEPVTGIVRRTLPAGGQAHVCLGPDTAHPMDAARVNGTAAHALDFDDVSIQGHPSAVLLAALLPEAEVLGASGRDFLDAYVMGFEAWAELVLREPDQHHRKGWHPTGLFGAVGAAAACARLRRLGPRESAHALGIAASQSAGVMANFGSMVKPFHAGSAACTGVLSARLAAEGMQASPDAIEHPQGLLRAASPAGRVDLDSPVRAASDWHLLARGLTIKKYPTCLSTHRGLDGMHELLAQGTLPAGSVRRVTVRMSARNATILHAHRPRTALEGKFSIEFAVAAMLAAGRLTLAELTDDFVLRDDVQALIRRVAVEHDSREDPLTGYAPEDTITIETEDGRRLATSVSDMRGTPANPIGDRELFAKFESCLRVADYGAPAQALFESFLDLAAVPDMSAFVRRWAGAARRKENIEREVTHHG
ncbi:MmgE/PrpD family protein [Pigmentiphaga soli]|uniref:MmgE/PrpD family protein n=1 Tax=Pigmentiphaga soli TaxID=1007095 RepID=A0ABP8HP35_9BURK